MKKDYYFVITLPVLILLEGLFVQPRWTVDIDVFISTFPILQVFVIIILLRRGIVVLNLLEKLIISFMFISVIWSIIYFNLTNTYSELFFKYNFGLERLSIIIIILLAFVINGRYKRSDKRIEIYRKLVLVYTFLSFLIYAYRFVNYGGDLIRTRSGSNIFGGNPLWSAQVLFLILCLIKDRYLDKTVSLLSLVTAIIYINRLSIICSVLIIVLHIPNLLRKYKMFIILSLLLLSTWLDEILKSSALFEAIIFRFGGNADFDYATLTRQVIWHDAWLKGLEIPFSGVGIGAHKFYLRHTSAHSIVLNNHVEFGLVFGGLLLVAFIIYNLKLILTCRNYKACIISLLWFSVATLAGLEYFQASGYYSGITFILMLAIISETYNERWVKTKI